MLPVCINNILKILPVKVVPSYISSTFSSHFLTEMEKKVAEELIKDKSNQEIADSLFISKRCIWQVKNAEFGNHFVHSLARLNF